MTQQTITLTLPKLYEKQRAAVYDPARYSVIEASTKSGKTAGCLTWLVAEAWEHGKPGRNYWWIAPVFPVAMIAYRRLYRMLANEDGNKAAWTSNATEVWIELASGGRIWFKSADKPDSLYGEDVWAAVIDEASRCKSEAWHAIRSTLTATRGPIRIIGNVKGRRNWAYELARKAEAGAPDMAYHKLIAHDAIDAGILDAAEVADAKAMLPDAVFRELYLAEPSDDGGNPFGLAAIAAIIAQGLQPGPAVAFGVDLAKSQDWAVVCGLNAEGDVCLLERWQSDWGATRRRIPALIGEVPTLIDSTGVGDPIVEDLQRQCPNVEGFKFTAPSKQQLMEGLSSAIQQATIGVPAGWLVGELESFEFEYTRTGVRYSAPEGLHDDGVCALALAVRKHGGFGGGTPLTFVGSVPDTRSSEDRQIEHRRAVLTSDDPNIWS